MKSIIPLCGAAAYLAAICAAHGSPPHKKTARQPSKAKSASSQAQSGRSAWHSDPALARALGPPISIQGYAMRLPIDYREALPPRGVPGGPPPTYEPHLFTRIGLGSESAPTLTVSITPASGALSLDAAMDTDISQIKHALKNFTQGPLQRGALAGIPFARVAFKGSRPGPAGPIAVHGVAYAAIDGREIIEMQAEASGDNSQAALSVVEAAILTFRKNTTMD